MDADNKERNIIHTGMYMQKQNIKNYRIPLCYSMSVSSGCSVLYFGFRALADYKYKKLLVNIDFNFHIKTMFSLSLPPWPVVCWMVHVLFTLFVFAYVQWCPTPIVLCFCLVCLCLVYRMLPVSLDCRFFIAPSVLSNINSKNFVS